MNHDSHNYIWVKRLKRVARSDGLSSPCAMTSIIFHLLRVPAAGTAGAEEEGGDDDEIVILAAVHLITSSSLDIDEDFNFH